MWRNWRREPALEQKCSAVLRYVSPDFFHTMGTPLLQGRSFTEQDGKGKTWSVIMNEAAARRFWPDENLIGKYLTLGSGAPGWPLSCEVVGVIGDVRHHGLKADVALEVFASYRRNRRPSAFVAVRTDGDPRGLTEAIRHEILAAGADEDIRDVMTMRQRLSAEFDKPRRHLLLLVAVAAVALFLAAVGIYGVMSYAVSQRIREIGIRITLGANTTDILKSVVRSGLRLTFVGVAIGLAGAFALTRVISSLLYEVSPADPMTFAYVALLLVGIALAASYIPARRATKIDPMEALRYE